MQLIWWIWCCFNHAWGAGEREFKGTWINTNMQSHESFAGSTSQVPFATFSVRSADATNVRTVGMLAVLTNEKSLYGPGAFGGATIEDPWETLGMYKQRLEANEGVDLVIPLCHLYESQDNKTASLFDFPVILSGHDHHHLDRVANGSRILKPGQDAHLATILDVTWDDAGEHTPPTITARHVRVTDSPADPDLAKLAEDSYRCLSHLRQTQLATIDDTFRPFTSVAVRDGRVTAATYICTMLLRALNLFIDDGLGVDAVLLQGGYFKAGA